MTALVAALAVLAVLVLEYEVIELRLPGVVERDQLAIENGGLRADARRDGVGERGLT
jgi:hypothetical protein